MMMSQSTKLILSISAVVIVCIIASVNGLDGNGERCTISEGSGISVDTCDGSKFLTCNGGRCQCPDNVNHIYTYKYVAEKSRSRRSPKKGGGALKKVAIGAGGAYVGYKVGKAVGGGGGGSSISVSRNSDRDNDNNGKKVYSCYGRIGAQCNLNYNQYNIVSTTTTASTSSTSAAPTPAPEVNVTSSTTESAATTVPSDVSVSTSTVSTTTAAALPVAAAQIADAPKLPSCVAHAVCNSRSSLASSGNSSHVVKITLDGDPRIGVCQCKEGYEHRKSDDLCARSFGESIHSSLALVFGLLSAIRVFSH